MLLCSNVGTLLTVDFLGQNTVTINALPLAPRTMSGATVPATYANPSSLGLPGRTATQVTLPLRTNRPVGQALLLHTDF